MTRVPLGRTALVVQALAAIALVVLLLRAEGVPLPFSAGGKWTVQLQLADAGGLSDGSRAPVTVAGVVEGRVASVRYRDGIAVAELELDHSARGALRADTVATVIARSALQDLVVSLSPGSRTAPPLAPGAVIPTSRSSAPVTLDQVLAVLDAGTRAQLQVLLAELARGIGAHPGALGAALTALGPDLDPVDRVLALLAQRRTLLGQLTDELDTVFTALSGHDRALARALADGNRTLATTGAAGGGALAGVLADLPGAISALDGALRSLATLGPPLAPALAQLDRTAAALPGALSAVRSATPALSGALLALQRLTGPAAGTLASAADAAGRLAPVADQAPPALRAAQRITAAIDANRDGIGALGARFSGVFSTDLNDGPIVRGLGFFQPFDPADFGVPGASGTRLLTLQTQVISALTAVCEHENLVACLVRYLVPGLPGAVASLPELRP
ncbi:MAG TPA: MlaD family protein [Solirubrobacteraceae bacterium]|jgi:phospholipid/cholesterol/gamma-HCH transport system substrate-binding protein|nr:MlaD family protein [Solirubrobacteraceae bacterium]